MAAATGLLRRAAGAALPRLPSGLQLIPTPPPARLTEAQSLVVPGLGATPGAAMDLMAVPKKKVFSLLPVLFSGSDSNILVSSECDSLSRCVPFVVILSDAVIYDSAFEVFVELPGSRKGP
jgi:hypothetical protein